MVQSKSALFAEMTCRCEPECVIPRNVLFISIDAMVEYALKGIGGTTIMLSIWQFLTLTIKLRPLLLTLHQLKIVADDAQDLALMSLSLELPPESAFGLASIQVYRYSHT